MDRDKLPFWLNALTDAKPEVSDWLITRVIYPGTHDSGTYGKGEGYTRVGRFNWCCQTLNFYDQAKVGIRYFDLRLKLEEDGGWWPHHAEAVKTGDILTGEGHATTVAQQFRQFIRENPNEIIILSVDVEPRDNKDFLRVFRDAFGGDAAFIPAPRDGNIPKVRQMRDERRNFVLSSLNMPVPDDGDVRHFADQYLWRQPGPGFLESFYDEPVYKSNSTERLKSALGNWMGGRSEELSRRDKFWTSQCMLTPSANNVTDVIKSLASKDITRAPQQLAEMVNPFIRDNICQDQQWKDHASIIVHDFADPDTALSIVRMNF